MGKPSTFANTCTDYLSSSYALALLHVTSTLMLYDTCSHRRSPAPKALSGLPTGRSTNHAQASTSPVSSQLIDQRHSTLGSIVEWLA
jgi:hypothetical protein